MCDVSDSFPPPIHCLFSCLQAFPRLDDMDSLLHCLHRAFRKHREDGNIAHPQVPRISSSSPLTPQVSVNALLLGI